MESEGPVHLNEEGGPKNEPALSTTREDWNAVIEGALGRLQWANIKPLPKDELLDGVIHAMYQPSRWSLGVDENSLNEPTLRYLDNDRYAKDKAMVWSNMKAVLRLATEWITNDEFLGFWVRLLSHRGGSDADIDENSPGAKEKVREVFNKMATRTHLTFGTLCDKDHVLRWGCTFPHPEAFQFFWQTTGKNARKLKGPVEVSTRNDDHDYCAPIIALHCCFRDLFHRKRDDFARLPAADSLKKQFKAAITLVHETAHAFFQVAQGRPCDEPLVFPTDFAGEVGHSWENYMFGGQIHGAGLWCKNEIRLMITPWADHEARVCHSVFISPAWVQTWFRKSTWEKSTLIRSGELSVGVLLKDPVLTGVETKNDSRDEQGNQVIKLTLLEHGEEIFSHYHRSPPRATASVGNVRKPWSLPVGVEEEYLNIDEHIARFRNKDGLYSITYFEDGRFVTSLWQEGPKGFVRKIFDPQIDKEFGALNARWKVEKHQVPGLPPAS
ncbi:hypothetical protein BU16DRAFT_597282 [Lophium mytilinum]|uniref:Uncharacterized protein n=1 Tax=Lophium mytilinum TaxID=390894 RepID=A0A6A6QCH6_9PEZI|nr:hypothetical protein BU16DRAFT_597282 [Lophium mytilinum]